MSKSKRNVYETFAWTVFRTLSSRTVYRTRRELSGVCKTRGTNAHTTVGVGDVTAVIVVSAAVTSQRRRRRRSRGKTFLPERFSLPSGCRRVRSILHRGSGGGALCTAHPVPFVPRPGTTLVGLRVHPLPRVTLTLVGFTPYPFTECRIVVSRSDERQQQRRHGENESTSP